MAVKERREVIAERVYNLHFRIRHSPSRFRRDIFKAAWHREQDRWTNRAKRTIFTCRYCKKRSWISSLHAGQIHDTIRITCHCGTVESTSTDKLFMAGGKWRQLLWECDRTGTKFIDLFRKE